MMQKLAKFLNIPEMYDKLTGRASQVPAAPEKDAEQVDRENTRDYELSRLLEIAQQEDEGRSANIDPDEQALIEAVLVPMEVEPEVFNETVTEYFSLRQGRNPEVIRAMSGERNMAFRKLVGFNYLLEHDITASMAFDEGNFEPLERILRQVGVDYGFPMDDLHKVPGSTVPSPMDVYVPIIRDFRNITLPAMRKGVNPNIDVTAGFLRTDADEESALLYYSLVSAAMQSEEAQEGRLVLDAKTAEKYDYIAENLEPLLVSIFEFSEGTVKGKIAEAKEKVRTRDSDIHRAVENIFAGRTPNIGSAEMKHLVQLKRVYEAVAGDDVLSANEYPLMDQALQMLGIRHAPTRYMLLNVEPEEGKPVRSYDLENLHQLYESDFFVEGARHTIV